MIRLTKAPLSAELTQQQEEELAELAALIDAGAPIPARLSGRYRSPAIKVLVRAECHDKCAYCEAKVTHVYPGDVEHIRPKALFPKLQLDFRNLTFSCFNCNNKKGVYYSEENPLINPYETNPGEHLLAAGPLLFEKPESQLGATTLAQLDLNRLELVERRQERLRMLHKLAVVAAARTGPARDAIIEELKQAIDDEAEFSFVARAFVALSCQAAIEQPNQLPQDAPAPKESPLHQPKDAQEPREPGVA